MLNRVKTLELALAHLLDASHGVISDWRGADQSVNPDLEQSLIKLSAACDKATHTLSRT